MMTLSFTPKTRSTRPGGPLADVPGLAACVQRHTSRPAAWRALK
ncbi:hypothetical protein [Pyxidicoccus xibeiensis]|nr:hypothetical protein [Pyxidicoccus xibeiensis]